MIPPSTEWFGICNRLAVSFPRGDFPNGGPRADDSNDRAWPGSRESRADIAAAGVEIRRQIKASVLPASGVCLTGRLGVSQHQAGSINRHSKHNPPPSPYRPEHAT
ncbi:unnamed protein product [Nezara viridula]|uniref:Uncharacterized protein n=1 Tax=Nezara viridula TaxID=85310 RepID=A0A9P0HI65_NEZVI|nr:unnamed protein product [Nezara viridula]